LCFEEVTQWSTPDPIDRLRGTLRSAEGVPPKMLLTGNPGGPGTGWVKSRYIDPAPSGYVPVTDPDTGLDRVFIPSRLDDNLALMRADPTYERRLLATGNAALVRAWRWGDWNITYGGYFDDIWQQRHVLRPFRIPSTWRYRRSFDWGSSSPSSLGLWAVSDGSPVREMGGFVFPAGSLIRFSEWYTIATDGQGNIKPNVGLRLVNTALGRGIAERCNGRSWETSVADPSIFSELGRDSIFTDLKRGAAEAGHQLTFDRADNNRVAGWQRLRDLLEESARDIPEKPGLWTFETCHNFVRTFPVLQRDEKYPDDIDTTQEDHFGDDARYMAMASNRRLGAVVN
jgi:hypothetical protein